MVQHLLPPGLRGIVVAGLLSALMGSLAGVFNACSTLFTVDIYEKLRPKASQHEIVSMGRIATAVMVLIAMAWIPVVKGAHGLYDYLQSVQGYLAPPIFVVFFFGVFWKRLNAQGCFWAMIVGFVVGLFRMLVDTPVTLGLFKSYPEGSFLWIVNNINFQYFSILITLISAVVMVVVSYMTAEPDQAQIKGLTFATATAEDRAETRASWTGRTWRPPAWSWSSSSAPTSTSRARIKHSTPGCVSSRHATRFFHVRLRCPPHLPSAAHTIRTVNSVECGFILLLLNLSLHALEQVQVQVQVQADILPK